MRLSDGRVEHGSDQPAGRKIPNNPVQLKRVLEAVLLSAQQPLTVGELKKGCSPRKSAATSCRVTA